MTADRAGNDVNLCTELEDSEGRESSSLAKAFSNSTGRGGTAPVGPIMVGDGPKPVTTKWVSWEEEGAKSSMHCLASHLGRIQGVQRYGRTH